MLEGHDLPHLEHRIVLRGDVPAGAVAWGDFLAAGDAVPEAEVDARVAALDGRRRGRHHLHVGHHREPEGRRVHPRPDAARLRRLGRHRRPAQRRPLPRHQPVLPLVRLQGRHRRLPHRRAPPSCRRPCSTSPRRRPTWPSTGSPRCPGRPAIYQTFLNHPDLDRSQLAVAAPRRHRRRAGARRAAQADGATSSASRPWSPPTGSPRRCGIVSVCRPDDPPETISATLGPRHPRRRGARRRRRRRARCRAASRARSWCGATT